MKKRILSVLFVIALLVAALMIPAQAADPDPDGNGCPHCTGTVTWTQWSGTAGTIKDEGHYKLTATTKTSYLDVSNMDIVIDVNGFNLYNDPGSTGRGAASRVLKVSNGGTVTVIDSSGTNKGAISGTATSNGSAVFISSGTVNLYGGIIKCNSTSYSNTAGGTVYVNGSGVLNVYGGEIRATTLTGATGSGGAIYTATADSQVNISGGKITGGTVLNKGTAIFVNGLLKISGTANISGKDGNTVYAKKEVILEGAPVVNGLSVDSACSVKVNTLSAGANIALADESITLAEANASLADYVAKGYITSYTPGMVLSVAADNKTISSAYYDCPCCDTEPSEIVWTPWVGSGGQPAAGTHYYVTGDGAWTQQAKSVAGEYTLNLNGHTLTGTTTRFAAFTSDMTLNIVDSGVNGTISTSYGTSNGAIFNVTAGTLKLYDGTFKQTNPDYSAVGAIAQCVTDGEIYVLGDAVVDARAVTGDKADRAALVCKTNMTIGGGTIIGGPNAPAVTVSQDATLTVLEGTNIDCLNGKLRNLGTLEGISTGALLMAQNSANGGVWYKTAQAAADLFVDADHDFIRLMGNATVKVTQPGTFFNINGHDLTVDPESTVPAKVANMKSSVTAVDPATVTADEGDIQLVTPYTDKVQFVALPNGEGAYTVHRLELQLTYVTFRPAAFGFYYKANFNTDDVLAAEIDAYGVALSLAGVPDASVSTKTELTDFTAARGTDVKFGGLFGIMKKENSATVNAENAMMKVYANCYVKIGDLVILSDNSNVGKKAEDPGFSGVGKSLFDVMQSLNGMTLEGEQLEAVNAFKESMTEMGVAWPEAGDTTLNTIPLA